MLYFKYLYTHSKCYQMIKLQRIGKKSRLGANPETRKYVMKPYNSSMHTVQDQLSTNYHHYQYNKIRITRFFSGRILYPSIIARINTSTHELDNIPPHIIAKKPPHIYVTTLSPIIDTRLLRCAAGTLIYTRQASETVISQH